MTTAPPPATVVPDLEQRVTELAGDILARSRDPRRGVDSASLQTHTSILRRLAGLTAARLPGETDRLIADAARDTALATAVALHTGLPFALLSLTGSDGLQTAGEVHAGERVTLVETIDGADRERILSDLRSAGVRIAGTVTAIGRDDTEWSSPGAEHRRLFRLNGADNVVWEAPR